MFKVEFLCEDKQLVKIKWLLDIPGIYEMHEIPVRNATTTATGGGKRKVVAKNKGGTLIEQLKEMIRGNTAIKSFKGATEIRPMIVELGGKPGGYQYYWQSLKKAGIIKTKKAGVYPIHRDKL